MAAVIDGIAIVLIGGAALAALSARQELDIRSAATMYAAVGALYEVLLIARFGQTAGKAIVGIAVVNVSGERPTIGQSGGRYLLKSLQPLGLLSRWIGTPSPFASALVGSGWEVVLLVSIATGRNGQGLHDRIARTTVVNVAYREPHSDRPPPLAARLSGRGTPVELITVERPRVPKRRVRTRR